MAKIFWTGNEQFKWLRALGWWLEAAMLRSLWSVFRMMSPARASATGRRMMRWIGPRLEKHRHVLANLRVALPGKDDDEIRRLGAEVWGNLGAVLAEFVHLGAITNMEAADPLIEIVCKNEDPDFLNHNKPCIFVAAHLGNWELSAFAIQHFGYPVDVVYSPLSNHYLEEILQRVREPLRCGFITKVHAVRQMYKNLKNGRSVGIHVDVRVEGGDLFPLLGGEATTTTTPAWLSQKAHCDIIPVRTERLGDARFRVTFFPAIRLEPGGAAAGEPIEELTLKMNQVIGALISENPGQWQCTKRRWPRDLMKELNVYRD